jgi:hypothetical protein
LLRFCGGRSERRGQNAARQRPVSGVRRGGSGVALGPVIAGAWCCPDRDAGPMSSGSSTAIPCRSRLEANAAKSTLARVWDSANLGAPRDRALAADRQTLLDVGPGVSSARRRLRADELLAGRAAQAGCERSWPERLLGNRMTTRQV